MSVHTEATEGDHAEDPARIPAAEEILPWIARRVSIAPFGAGWWSFNPCVHHDPERQIWRCVIRIANYSLPNGVPQLSSDSRGGRAISRNVMATLDPSTLELSNLREVRELDGRPRAPSCVSLGYEDMRLFRTRRDGLLGVATALQLNLEHPTCPEVVLCRIDDDGDVVDATPLRGPWNSGPQKNWSPFDGADEPRFLYSIERGVVMGEDGPVAGSPPPTHAQPRQLSGVPAASVGRSGVEVKLMGKARSTSHPPTPGVPAPGSTELRGGSQLVEIERGRWLGIAHEMRLRAPDRKKFYWHTFYVVDGWGQLRERSRPLKLSGQHGIEFAAGIAIDGDGGLAISFGTDDHDAWIAATRLDAVRAILRPVGEEEESIGP